MKATVRLKSFEGHKGIPGKRGGSLPRNSTDQRKMSDSEHRHAWAINIANSDLMSSLYKNVYRREELQSLMQEFPYANQSKDEFVSSLKQAMTSDEVLPKPTTPKGGWMWALSSNKMLPEIMWYLREHFRIHGAGSQIITPEDFRKYSNGHVSEKTLGILYQNSLRKYFQWERAGGLDQFRLSNNYKFSENGISTKAQIISDQMKSIGMTPEKLYDELMKTEPVY
jgi:hypothetical protein